MQDNLALFLKWRMVNQNGYLVSHVGEATNIFGVPSHSGGDTHDNQQQ